MEGYLILVETRPNTYRHGWCVNAEKAMELVVTFGEADILKQQFEYPSYMAYSCTNDQYSLFSKVFEKYITVPDWVSFRTSLNDTIMNIRWACELEDTIDDLIDQRSLYAFA